MNGFIHRKPSVAAMRAHIMDLINEFDLIYHFVARTTQAQAVFEFEEIWIPEIKSRVSYATALHEIGHIRSRHHTSQWTMVRERAAWNWAKTHALIWTETMERQRQGSLAWYETAIKSGAATRAHGRASPNFLL